MVHFSFVIPVLNEEGNLRLLHEKLSQTCMAIGKPYEIILIDDGSTDQSLALLQQLFISDPDHVRVIQLRRNFGKTAALVAGFGQATGTVLISLDADLQDDPAEVPKLLETLEQGYDLVVGWRKNRMDNMDKTWPSRVFNWAVTHFTQVPLHDFNCGFKVYRREVLESVRLYSDLHRYIPILAVWQGFKVTERVVTHHPRHSGKSKYGAGRMLRGLMDFAMVLFIIRYLRNPLRFFGWLGAGIFSIGTALNLYFALLWLARWTGLADVPSIGTRPLFQVAILCMLLGIQFFSLGLLGELIRYFSYRPQDEYTIRRIWAQEELSL